MTILLVSAGDHRRTFDDLDWQTARGVDHCRASPLSSCADSRRSTGRIIIFNNGVTVQSNSSMAA
ncbi:MAG: hypothetical protein AAGC80_15180 [Rhodococcus sp. (in: high G+C Gram-positive bacteria)]